MSKKISFIFALFILLMPVLSFAQTEGEAGTENKKTLTITILPQPSETDDCDGLITGGDTGLEEKYANGKCLAQKIQTGKIHYRDIPYFIGYIIKFLLSVGWAVAVVMIIAGGYQYVLSGFGVEEKEKGKKTIILAVTGLAIITFAWLMVDTFIAFLTS